MPLIKRLSLGLLTVFLVACASNPVTGKRDLVFMSTEQEIALGQKNYLPAQQQQGGQYTVDPELSRYVAGVGAKLAAVSDRPNLPYEFVVLNNDVPNAWAMPGGKIAINRGLLIHLEDEAQLAAVIGHEIVHAAARHGAQQQSQSILVNIGIAATAIAAQKKEKYGGAAVLAAGIGAQAWMARYSRANETESDRYGIEYMVRAGYEPRAAVELQETFVKLSAGRSSSWFKDFFASHPPSQARVEANRKQAETLSRGVRNKAAFDRAMAQLRRDSEAYKANTKAVDTLQAGDTKGALTLVNQAIASQPKEGLFWQTKGKILHKQGDKAGAEAAFGKAIAYSPALFSGYLQRGLVRAERGNNAAAEKDLLASRRYLSTVTASYHLGELAQARGDKSLARQYYSEAAQGEGDLAKSAQERLQQL